MGILISAFGVDHGLSKSLIGYRPKGVPITQLSRSSLDDLRTNLRWAKAKRMADSQFRYRKSREIPDKGMPAARHSPSDAAKARNHWGTTRHSNWVDAHSSYIPRNHPSRTTPLLNPQPKPKQKSHLSRHKVAYGAGAVGIAGAGTGIGVATHKKKK